MPNIVVHCREENTIKKYNSSFKEWKLWAKQHNFTTLPANSFTVALFLMNCIQKDYSFPKIEGIYFAIKFYHKFLGYTDPSIPFVVSTILEAAERLSVHKTRKKKPIIIEQLELLYQILAVKRKIFSSFRLLTMCILGFYGFMRYSEISNCRRSDITFHDTFMKVFIEKCKTDVYHKGNWIYMIKSTGNLCPVKILQNYFNFALISDK